MGKAGVCLGGSLIGWVVALSSLEKNDDGELEVIDVSEGIAVIGMLFGIGSHVYSIIDAPLSAIKNNKRLENRFNL